ncbi:MAG: 2-dehydropantoate 2-reductase [Armatimonadota bacterium]
MAKATESKAMQGDTLPDGAHIVVVGPGSMGLVHAAFLHAAGRRVTLLDYRPERAERIHSGGVSVTGAADLHADVSATADPAQIGTADLLIFFVKAYSTEAAVAHASPCIGERTALLTLQNGLGNVEHLISVASPRQVLAGTTSTGAYKTAEATVHLAGIGDVQIGSVGGNMALARRVVEILDEAGFPAQVADDVDTILWTKAIINAGINPLGALARVQNGHIPKIPALRLLQEGLVAEAAEIATTAGIEIEEDLLEYTRQICAQTAENRCSMLQDLSSGNQTEIAQINGYIATEGRHHDCPTLYNATVTRLVKAAQQL